LIIAFGLAGFSAYNSLIQPHKAAPVDTTMQVTKRSVNAFDSLPVRGNKPMKKVKNRLKKKSTVPANFKSSSKNKSLFGEALYANNYGRTTLH
jgi:hypothetical protein